MLHQLFAKSVNDGRKFSSVAELSRYLNRLQAYCIGKGVKPGVAKMHAGRIRKLAETKGKYITATV